MLKGFIATVAIVPTDPIASSVIIDIKDSFCMASAQPPDYDISTVD